MKPISAFMVCVPVPKFPALTRCAAEVQQPQQLSSPRRPPSISFLRIVMLCSARQANSKERSHQLEARIWIHCSATAHIPFSYSFTPLSSSQRRQPPASMKKEQFRRSADMIGTIPPLRQMVTSISVTAGVRGQK